MIRLRNQLLQADELGALLMLKVEPFDGQLSVLHDGDDTSLRHHVMLFDQFDLVASNGIVVNAPARYLLGHTGLFSQSVTDSSVLSPESVLAMTFEAFEALEAREPAQWIVALSEGSASPFDRSNLVDSFRIRLHNALPLPDREVPLDDVLGFKARRRSELLALRHYIDEISLDVAANPDTPLAERLALNKFNVALADWSQAMREPNWKKIIANFSLDASLLPGMMAAGTTLATGATLLAAAAVGLSTTIGELSLTYSRKSKSGQAGKPFQYLTSVEQYLY